MQSLPSIYFKKHSFKFKEDFENSLGKQNSIEEEDSSSSTKISPTQKQPNNIIKALIKKRNSEGTTEDLNNPLKIQQMILKNKNGRIGGNSTAMPTYEKVRRHKRRYFFGVINCWKFVNIF
ncbi:unnamed protein product [Meloidogyne enterolobii]|uniref:Uncharacterized protein n=1 Tax=Meloidogyne enterolobii TaxID=390850 RepID=A0ACB1AQH0_MELEN